MSATQTIIRPDGSTRTLSRAIRPVANEAARLALSNGQIPASKLVYQVDSDTLWRCIDDALPGSSAAWFAEGGTGGAIGRQEINQPNGVAGLNEDGELVGPIIGRMILESDTTTVPTLGEQVAIVDSLTAPTRAQARVGDGITPKGLASAPSLAPISCTNAQRLAGSGPAFGIAPGQVVSVSDQANRLEQYLGGGTNENANWLVLRNTAYLSNVTNVAGAGSVTVNGTLVNAGNSLNNLGWVDLTSFPSADPISLVLLNAGIAPGAFVDGVAYIANGGPIVATFGGGTLPFPVPLPPRAYIQIQVVPQIFV